MIGLEERPYPIWSGTRSEEHTFELQSHLNLVCRLLLEKKKEAPRHLELAQRHPHSALRHSTNHAAADQRPHDLDVEAHHDTTAQSTHQSPPEGYPHNDQ